MKERIFFDDEFETQLREKSDQFKMYPSDKVWTGVHHSLHTRRRGFVAGMSLLIGGFLILAGTQLISPSSNTKHTQTAVKTIPQPENASSLDLSAFNPSAFQSNPNAANRASRNHAQRNRTSFILAFPGFAENASGLNAEDQAPVQVKSEIGAIPKNDRSANIILKKMESAGTPPLSLSEQKTSAQKLPELAEVADAVAFSERSATQTTHLHNDRFSWEIYISPTLNTRHLDGIQYQNMNPTIQNAPITVVRFADVNGFVDKTPAMGYDLGGNILYQLSRNFSLKAGLQFSFSRYYIKTYNSNQPQASAALNSYFGYVADSLISSNTGNRVNPKNPQHYQNNFYQLSMPVGIEWKVAGKGRLAFHLGASIQPGYLLNRDAYMLSDDYSSYSKEPMLLRKWNFNAGAEAFISYRAGKIRWELGPMVRYQILSTYKNSYPLKENLMNYGIRLGFSKTIR
jgi:hypothetical protein